MPGSEKIEKERERNRKGAKNKLKDDFYIN